MSGLRVGTTVMAKTDTGSLSTWSISLSQIQCSFSQSIFSSLTDKREYFFYELIFGLCKMLNVFMAKPWLWSPLSGFSVPKGAFNSCPLNFRSHWMGLLFIAIVESWMPLSILLMVYQRLVAEEYFSLLLCRIKGIGWPKGLGTAQWVKHSPCTHRFSVSWRRQTQDQAVTGVSTRRKGRMKL